VSAVADKYSELQRLGCEVISVSVDSHFVHKMWNDHELTKMVEGGVPFHMASDQAGNVGRAYGVWDETQGIELRGRFIIDPDGVIQAAEVLTPPVGRCFSGTAGEGGARPHIPKIIIDPDGVIQAAEVLTPPVGRRFAETVRQVQAFQHVRNTKGTEATPAGWLPGQPTLKPGPDLVGNVWKVWKPGMEK
jgi:alkyl hydroperoxide reductase subunit AhpC